MCGKCVMPHFKGLMSSMCGMFISRTLNKASPCVFGDDVCFCSRLHIIESHSAIIVC